MKKEHVTGESSKKIRSSGGDPLLITGGPIHNWPEARYVKFEVPADAQVYKRQKRWKWGTTLAEIKIYPTGSKEEVDQIVEEEDKGTYKNLK